MTFNKLGYSDFLEKYQKKEVIEYSNEVTKRVLVSVIVTTYNHSLFISECLDNILAQHTNFDFEVIIGDDESNDGCRLICTNYAKANNSKIRLLLHARRNNININGLPTGRFNFIYNAYSARGKYIALCDGDDYWTDPNKLQKQVDFLELNQDYSMTYSDCNLLKEGIHLGTKLEAKNKKDWNYNELLRFPTLPTCTVLFRNIPEVFLSFYKHLNVTNGDALLFALLGKYGKAKYLEIEGCVYRQHKTGIYSNLKEVERNKNRRKLCKALYQEVEKPYKRILLENISKYYLKDAKIKSKEGLWPIRSALGYFYYAIRANKLKRTSSKKFLKLLLRID